MRLLSVFCALIFTLTACKNLYPVYTVENNPIYTASGRTLTLAEVRHAIIQGARSKTWSTKELDSGTIVARVGKGVIEAVVTIRFTAQEYSISYRDSTKLSYKDGKVRSKYNLWVRKLHAQIEGELTKL